MSAMKPLVIFDFDGTIADSIPLALKMYNQLAREYRLNTIDQQQFVELRSLSIGAIIKELGIPWSKIPQLIRRGRELMGQRSGDLSPCAGIVQMIQHLDAGEQAFAVLTSNAGKNVERFFACHQIPAPRFIDSVSRLQNKSVYLKKRKREYDDRQLIYVGDEVRDIEAARVAEINSIAVDWGFNTHASLMQAGPGNVVSDAHQLLEAIERIGHMPDPYAQSSNM